jgi:hypothetical protein
MIQYHILSTGSEGNAVIIHDFVMVDCGVSWKLIEPYAKSLRLVLITHIHVDHLKKQTVKRLAAERPSLRFGCGRFVVPSLLNAGVRESNIDILDADVMYGYGPVNVIPVVLTHNVPNYGYKLHFRDGKVFYATDTGNLAGIVARHYDLYMVEANYGEKEIQERIKKKEEAGLFSYEHSVLKNHLSLEQCNDFIYRNIGPGGEYVYLHQHRERDENGHKRKDSSD